MTGSIPPAYTIVEHTADTGFKVQGLSLALLFQHAAQVLFYLMWDSPGQPVDVPIPVFVQGHDPEELLVNFLEEFVYLYEVKELVFTRVTVDVVGRDFVQATAWCHPFVPFHDVQCLGVKAITYHQLHVNKTDTGWSATVVLDI